MVIAFIISFWLALLSLHPLQAQTAGQRQEFLDRFARSYFPGRSGQIMLVPEEGVIITEKNSENEFMHGSPWEYDSRVPLLLYGPSHVRSGSYQSPAAHQDIAPTLAAWLDLPLPKVVTGRVLEEAIHRSSTPPRVIFLAVLDAMRADYFDRYAASLPNLNRLREKGAWFERMTVNYLPTATAVAHATIATGADPQIHGIIANSFYERSAGEGQSPYPDDSLRNLMALTLADLWGIQTDGEAIIASQAGAYYAAAGLAGHGGCLLNGRRPMLLAYNSRAGTWESNPDCYRFPEYLKERTSDYLWREREDGWMGHDVSGPAAIRRSALFVRFEAEALISLIENEPLGEDQITDLVLANLKTTDYVAHKYGPDSEEIRQTLAELDRQFAEMIRALDDKVGSDHYVVVVTADHGMPEEPEEPAQRVYTEDIVASLHGRFDPAGKLVVYYEASSSQLFIDPNRLETLGLTLSRIREYLESRPFIFAAYTEDEIQHANP